MPTSATERSIKRQDGVHAKARKYDEIARWARQVGIPWATAIEEWNTLPELPEQLRVDAGADEKRTALLERIWSYEARNAGYGLARSDHGHLIAAVRSAFHLAVLMEVPAAERGKDWTAEVSMWNRRDMDARNRLTQARPLELPIEDLFRHDTGRAAKSDGNEKFRTDFD